MQKFCFVGCFTDFIIWGDHPLLTFCWEVDFIFAELLVVKPLSFPTRTIQPTRKPKVIASVLDTRGEGSAGSAGNASKGFLMIATSSYSDRIGQNS